MADARLAGILRRLHTGLAPAIVAGQSDRQALCAFIAHKDENAFAAIVHRHGPMVLRVCRRLLHHAQDAEDAFQATFLVLARKAETIGKSESLSSWLHGVALRTSLRAKRDDGRRRARERQFEKPVGPDPAEAIDWRDVQIVLEAEIQRLPERYRSAFILCFLEGRSRAEAGEELGVEENTISSRLARARERLRRRLASRGINLSAVLAAVALSAGATGSAMPAELFANTVRAAWQFAVRQPVTGVSSLTLQLTNGAMQTMAIAKLKWAVGVLMVGGSFAIGTWGVAQGPGPLPGSGGGPPATADSRDEKPATVERTADYAQRQRSLKNLKQILLAMHNYHDAMGHFPTDVVDKTGKPLLSWRVDLLPYMEQDNLYKQFRRDESWDSEHNLRLLAQMPDVLRVGFEPKGATHTYYQRFNIVGLGADGAAGGEGGGSTGPAGASTPGALPTGPAIKGPAGAGESGGSSATSTPGQSGRGPAGPRFPVRMTEVTDGLSNTLGLIEAGPPVPWTKPADFVYDPKKPLPKFAGPFVNVRNAAALDGAAYGLKPDVDEKTLRLLIDPNDGNPVPRLTSLRARFAADTEEEKKALARIVNENAAMISTFEAQSKDFADLLRLWNKSTRDMDQAEGTQERMNRLLEQFKALNKKYRDEMGIGSRGAIPKEP